MLERCGFNVKFSATNSFSCFTIKAKHKLLAALTVLKVKYFGRNAKLFLYLKKC